MPREKRTGKRWTPISDLIQEKLFDKPAAEKEYKIFKTTTAAKVAASAAGLDLDEFTEKDDFEDAFDLISESTKITSDISKLESVVGEREAAEETRSLAKKALGEEGSELRLEKITEEGKIFERVETKEEKRREDIRKGRAKGTEEAFKQAEGVKRAFKKLASITRQFNEALPQEESGQFGTIPARIRGFTASLGATSGVAPNPQLNALARTAKLQLRSVLRDMGEGARLSDQDIKQNIAIMEQAGLSEAERMELVSTFIQTAIDSMDSDTLKVIEEDEESLRVLKEFGVTTAKMRARKSTEGEGSIIKLPSGGTLRLGGR